MDRRYPGRVPALSVCLRWVLHSSKKRLPDDQSDYEQTTESMTHLSVVDAIIRRAVLGHNSSESDRKVSVSFLFL